MENLVVLAMIGILTSLLVVDWGLFWEKQSLQEASRVVKDAIQHTQILAVTRRQNQKLEVAGQSIWISDSPSSANKILFDQVAEGIELQMTGVLTFTPYGFSRAGSITIQSATYSARIVVNSIGGVRSENTALKSP